MYVPSSSAQFIPVESERRPPWYRVPGVRIIAGEYPGHPDAAVTRIKLRALLQAGVTFFLDLTERDERPQYDTILRDEALAQEIEVLHVRCPLRDLAVPESQEEMSGILATLEHALADGHTIYLHCWAGVGRTGTVVGCFLTGAGVSGAEALSRLACLWQTVDQFDRYPRSPETNEQHEFVRRWIERSR